MSRDDKHDEIRALLQWCVDHDGECLGDHQAILDSAIEALNNGPSAEPRTSVPEAREGAHQLRNELANYLPDLNGTFRLPENIVMRIKAALLSAPSSIAPLHADALDALVELVRLKRIKERMEETGTPNGPNNADLTDLERDYKAAKPAAWGYAKSVVDGAPRSAMGEKPLPMVLHCPECGLQHVDAKETHGLAEGEQEPEEPAWNNPPHRSHLCHGCGCIWRPADVPTDGVKAITTRGKADTWPNNRADDTGAKGG